MPRLLPVALAALVLASGGVLAACGSDDSSKSTSAAAPTTSGPATSPPTTSTPTTTGGATAETGKTVAISMKDIAFNPNAATVKVGEKVVWTNDDSVQHDVVAQSGASFKSQIFGKGATYAYTPTKPGKIAYVCTIHPGMDGTLDVTK